mgnify:CR=1 FL=1
MAHPIIPVTQNTNPRLPHFKIETLQFGKHFTDHMLMADYENGEWIEVEPMSVKKDSFGKNKLFILN